MKLKYYLRGMGIGIILTAIVMGFALGGRKATLSDAEVIKRAKALGMTEATAEVLTQTQSEDSEVEGNDASSSNQTLDQIGEEIPEEINQELALSDPSVPEVVTEKEETESDVTEVDSSSDASTKESSDATSASSKAEEIKEPVKDVKTETESEADSAASATTSSAETESVTEAPSTGITDSTTTLNSTSKVVTIPGGMGSDGVASLLAREGIIDDAVAFNKYLVERRVDRIIRSGTKTIPANATYEEIARIITTG